MISLSHLKEGDLSLLLPNTHLQVWEHFIEVSLFDELTKVWVFQINALYEKQIDFWIRLFNHRQCL